MATAESQSDNDESKTNRQCTSIDKCIQTKRVLDALVYYQSLNIKQENDKQHNDVLLEFCTKKYKDLINDYNHIIIHHNNHIELLHDFMQNNNKYKQLLLCQFVSCPMYKRSNRNRQNDDNINGIDNLSFVFWRDLLDQTHSFILHSFDSGIRIKTKHQKSTDNDTNDDEKKGDDVQDEANSFDSTLDAISNDILKRQKDLNKIDIENNRIKTHKYDLNMNIDKKDAHFSVGYTFYYWDYYKNENNMKQYWFNTNDYLGHQVSDLYIEPKYDSFKQELLNNGIQSIKPIIFQQIFEKAKIYMFCTLIKGIVAGDEEEFLHYGIKYESPITIQHIMSILFYTDLSELSRSFSSTFRLLHRSELLSSIKNRNREYWNWSKLIRETVEYFGDLMEFEKSTPFYCGVGNMIISSYLIRLCSPTSTSKQLSVAYTFADHDGIVLQINGGSNYYAANLRYFNCSWISCYNDEDERLFVGGSWPLRVESVRLIKEKQNLQWFFKALFYLECMVNGISITSDAKEKISKSDKFILQKLIKQKLNIKENKFLKYINHSFGAFCHHKKQIVINQRQIAEHLSSFKDILFISKQSNMIKLDFISGLFPNCKNIVIYDDENQYQFDLSEFLIICNKTIQSTDNNIQQIDVKVWRGDNDENTWLNIAFAAINNVESNNNVQISKQTELNDETWDVMVIKSGNN